MEIVECYFEIDGKMFVVMGSIIRKNFLKCAEYLFDHCGVNINIRWLVETAIKYKHTDMILLLLDRGAKINQDLLQQIKDVTTIKRIISFLIKKKNIDINEYKNLLLNCVSGIRQDVGELVIFFIKQGYHLDDVEKIKILSTLIGYNVMPTIDGAPIPIPDLNTLKILLEYGFRFDFYLPNGISFFCMFLIYFHKNFETHTDIFDLIISTGAQKIPYYENKSLGLDLTKDRFASEHLRDLLKRFDPN